MHASKHSADYFARKWREQGAAAPSGIDNGKKKGRKTQTQAHARDTALARICQPAGHLCATVYDRRGLRKHLMFYNYFVVVVKTGLKGP